MFDIGGLEILLVLIIALLVIGPERMPEVARQIGRFVAKTRNFIRSVQEESELKETVAELRRELDLREETAQLREIEQDLQHDLYGNLREAQNDLADELDLDKLQRPTFGGSEPPPLHIDKQDPTAAAAPKKAAETPDRPEPKTAEKPSVQPVEHSTSS
ncbi:sec-independent protein translocase protein TatB [Sulfurivirga caldicuralii]|uniref:Sec-independent protein translocase protein TatB n=1 Tax=Sulfurivirga caldicuralii TaxID=364032 RepID=A0A1N6DEP6_9GAMM|nr:Sec-independent protein translocase protein TatB [Sulfurivirga caldicuralii]SIN69104.1 sec-independent protein translocase protein TatB [Sulfurivirga caldicuralii]